MDDTFNKYEDYLKFSADKLKQITDRGAKFPEFEAKLIRFVTDIASKNVAINSLSIATRAEILIQQDP